MSLTAEPEEVQEVQLQVAGGQLLHILNGVVTFTFTGGGGDWKRDTLSFSVGPAIPASQFMGGTVICFPTSVKSTSGSQVGWAIDNSTLTHSGDGPVTVAADLAVYASSNQKLFRIAFQVMVLEQVTLSPV
jgi:hypothetical protein